MRLPGRFPPPRAAEAACRRKALHTRERIVATFVEAEPPELLFPDESFDLDL